MRPENILSFPLEFLQFFKQRDRPGKPLRARTTDHRRHPSLLLHMLYPDIAIQKDRCHHKPEEYWQLDVIQRPACPDKRIAHKKNRPKRKLQPSQPQIPKHRALQTRQLALCLHDTVRIADPVDHRYVPDIPGNAHHRTSKKHPKGDHHDRLRMPHEPTKSHQRQPRDPYHDPQDPRPHKRPKLRPNLLLLLLHKDPPAYRYRPLQPGIKTLPEFLKFICTHKIFLKVLNCCRNRSLIRLNLVATFVSVIPRISAISR